MTNCDGTDAPHCSRCEQALDFDFLMAFQPVVDVSAATVHAYEALVRGPAGESAASILAKVDAGNVYAFDQACRVRALEQAHRLGCDRKLSINFLPNAVYTPEACIRATLATAERLGWPTGRLMFEIIETEAVRDRRHLQDIVESYRAMGFTTALDDFGTGYANLDLLVDLRPDVIKLDRQLVRAVDQTPRRQLLVDSLIVLAAKLDITVVAEGVETRAEAAWLYAHGIKLQQGYYFARPALDALPAVDESELVALRRDQARI